MEKKQKRDQRKGNENTNACVPSLVILYCSGGWLCNGVLRRGK